MEHLFDEILEKDEKIIKIIKPHKGRYLLGYCWFFMIPLFWPHLILLMLVTGFMAPYFLNRAYKNTYYAYTNKRLIKRSGIFWNSYDSLEYKGITSTSVKVGYWDTKRKTGTLVFVSPSSHHEHPMEFSYIVDPYKTMNEIKEYISCINKL